MRQGSVVWGYHATGAAALADENPLLRGLTAPSDDTHRAKKLAGRQNVILTLGEKKRVRGFEENDREVCARSRRDYHYEVKRRVLF